MTLKLTPKNNQRILIMSDLHGNLSLFEKALLELNFCTDDILIINGDISEKGDDSIGLFRKIIKLKENHEVYATLGNCDELILFLNDDSRNKGMEHYMMNRDKTILSEILQVFGEYTNFEALRQFAKKNYADIFSFVEGMHLKIDTPYFQVVHAGINPIEPDDHTYCTRTQAFLRNEFRFDKPVIVGHYPTCLYSNEYLSYDAILNTDKNIFAIDGGNSIKEQGQINVLEIHDASFVSHRFDLLDYIPQFKTQHRQDGIHVNWEDLDIEIIDKHEEYSLCSHISSQKRFKIYNEFLDFNTESLIMDYTDSLIQINENDAVHIIAETSFGYYLKCNGSLGWLLK